MSHRTLKSAFVAVLCVAALAACEQSATSPVGAPEGPSLAVVPADLNEKFELPVGDTATINGEGLTIIFTQVTEDSRCPIGVNCFWEGDGEVELVLSKSGYTTQTVTLHTTLTPQAVMYAGYTISLLELAPYPVYPNPIDPNDYVATLLVE
jgi:hypothetical protein